jgi:tetratricopeptide (TPR) repeat protein
MSNLLIGLLGALVATNQPAAISNLANQTAGISLSITNDPVSVELQKIMKEDDAAQAEINQWRHARKSEVEKKDDLSAHELDERIRKRLAPVRKSYEDFVQHHPDHSLARLVYGGFLNDQGEEAAALAHWEKAKELDPKNAAVWNNLANHYGEHGPVKKAFEYYARAIELDPSEPLYLRNLADTVSLFRKEAMAYYQLDEQQVFRKALSLYQQALKSDPQNFQIARDIAQTYYGIKPTQTEDALNAWTNALNLASTDLERQNVYLHLARFKLNAERFDEAREQLKAVTNEMYSGQKQSLLKNIEARQFKMTPSSPPHETTQPATK